MALEIIRDYRPLSAEKVYVYPVAHQVGVSFGPLFQLIQPREARELADALIQAANAATRKERAA